MNHKHAILGIDPGINGGIALYQHFNSQWRVFPMPTSKPKKGKSRIDTTKLSIMIRDALFVGVEIDLVVLERVWAIPGQGRRQGAASMFTFGMNYGRLLGWIESKGWRLENPTPQKWQKAVLGEMSDNKNFAIEYARQHIADNLLKKELKNGKRSKNYHDGMADAVCLVSYGRSLL